MDKVGRCNYPYNCAYNVDGDCTTRRPCKDKSTQVKIQSHLNKAIRKALRVDNVVGTDLSAGMTAGVYYATYGHWTLSLLQAGFDVRWHVQPNIENYELVDQFASGILVNNFPTIKIPKVHDFENCMDDRVDLICGSPPCIGFSMGNPTSGANHPANKNFINMFEFIAYYRPKYYLVEMVPRILKPGFGQEIMLKAMEKVDMYKTRVVSEFKIENYGSPARRDRCYFFGSLEESPDFLWEFMRDFSGRVVGKSVDVLAKEEYARFRGVMEQEGEIVSRYDRGGKLRTGPFRSSLKDSRVLKPNEPAFTITGMAYCNMKHWDGDGKLNRFLACSEIADLMGFPIDYDYMVGNLHRKNLADIKCKIIASGVDIRFTSKLLKYIAGGVNNGSS